MSDMKKGSQSGQNEANYFERPKKRGNPSHIIWSRMSRIIRDNIDTFPQNANFNEIAHIVEDLAKSYGISLPRWAVGTFTNQILDLYSCLDYLCQLKSADISLLHNYLVIGNEVLQQLAFSSNQFKKLTNRQLIEILLSHVSLLKKILEIINNQNNK